MLNTKFWKKYFEVYDLLNVLEPYQTLLADIREPLGELKGMKVLDAGAGTGNLAVLLSREGAEVIALDFSEEGLGKYLEKFPSGKTLLHDLTEPLPFDSETFDAVVSNNTIYTLPRESRSYVFKEFYRVLKRGGKIVVSNVHTGFKPVKIYFSHIGWSLKHKGFLKTIGEVLRLFVPTIKIFYYNSLIIREHKGKNFAFMDKNEQKELLEATFFKEVSENKPTYAKQAILNYAIK